MDEQARRLQRLSLLVTSETSVHAIGDISRWNRAMDQRKPGDRWCEGWTHPTESELHTFSAASLHPWETRVDDALAVAAAFPHKPTAAAMMACGLRADVMISPSSGRHVLVPQRCRCRWCADCSIMRSRKVAANIISWGVGKTLRMVTLTQRALPEPCHVSVDRLQRAWRRFSKSDFARHHMKGGVSVTEITRNSEKGWYHCHRHMLVEGGWVSSRALGEAWSQAVGENVIADIRALHQGERAVRYVAKYVGKPVANVGKLPPHDAVALVRGLAGRRLCSTFGSAAGIRLARTPDADLRPSRWKGAADLWNALEAQDDDAWVATAEIAGADEQTVREWAMMKMSPPVGG